MTTTINADNGVSSGSAGLKYSSDGSGVLALQTNGTTAVTVDASQNVGVGVTNPGNKLSLPNASYIGWRNNAGSAETAGIRVNSSDAIEFYNVAERARIDSSGNVGIGTSSPGYKLDVSGSARVFSASAGANNMYFGAGRSTDYVFLDAFGYPTATDGYTIFGMRAYSSLVSSTVQVGNTQFAHEGAGTDNKAYYSISTHNGTTFGERMRIDSSGRVGIGATSPTYGLSVNSTTGVNSYDATSGKGRFVLGDPADSSGYVGIYRSAASTPGTSGNDLTVASYNTIAFTTGAASFASQTERMRITSVGEVLMGTTSAANPPSQGIANFGSITNSQIGIGHATGTGGGQYYLVFGYAGTTIGGIVQNGTTAVQYNTTSDYRLKENVQPIIGALAKVAALNPVTYTWKSAPDETGEGFIAHELAEVCPQAVAGEKDAVETYTDEDGNEQTRPKYQGIDTSFLVATLTAAIQELKAIVDTQAARIAALEAA